MSVVGRGYVCDAHEGHAAHMAMGDMAMGNIAMADLPMGNMPMDMPGHSTGGQDADADCTFPSSLAGCESMTSCAQSANVVDSPTIASPMRSNDEPTRFVHELRSVTRSPESPPPRA